MKYSGGVAAAIGAACLMAGAAPANAKTFSLIYDVQLEFVRDHVRILFEEGPDGEFPDETVITGECWWYDTTCYPEAEEWRPQGGRYSLLEPGDIIGLTLSLDVTSSPEEAGWYVGPIHCTLENGSDCRYDFYTTGQGFNPETGAFVATLVGWDGSLAKTIDLRSMTAEFASEFGPESWRRPEVGDPCDFSPSILERFCGYWDYEAHFKVSSFTVQGLHVIPVPPALPLLA